MFTKSLSFVEKLFWSLVWIFALLILGFFLLGLLENRFGGNFIGNLAGWVSSHAEPQQ
jgi:hypothetical protein